MHDKRSERQKGGFNSKQTRPSQTSSSHLQVTLYLHQCLFHHFCPCLKIFETKISAHSSPCPMKGHDWTTLGNPVPPWHRRYPRWYSQRNFTVALVPFPVRGQYEAIPALANSSLTHSAVHRELCHLTLSHHLSYRVYSP